MEASLFLNSKKNLKNILPNYTVTHASKFSPMRTKTYIEIITFEDAKVSVKRYISKIPNHLLEKALKMRVLLNALFVIFASTALPAFAYDPEIGELAKSLDNIEFVDGKKIDLKDFKGKPLVIYVGADWCPPCVSHGRPEALRVSKKFADAGLQTIFVSLDDNKIRDLKIEESKQIGLPIAMPLISEYPPYKGADRVRLLGSFGRAFLIPAAYVIDSDGITRAKMDSGRGIIGALEPAVKKVIK